MKFLLMLIVLLTENQICENYYIKFLMEKNWNFLENSDLHLKPLNFGMNIDFCGDIISENYHFTQNSEENSV